MRIRVLGPVSVLDDENDDATPGSPTQRIILAVLAAAHGQVVPADVLADAVWGDDPPRTAVSTLRSHVSRLRGLLGDELTIGPDGYRLAVREGLDADAFIASVRRADELEGPERASELAAADALWRGRAFGELADLPQVRATAHALEERRRSARVRLARAHHAAGDHAEAVVVAESLLADDALRESAWCTLVEALSATGRTAEALRAAQRARDALAEAGLEVSGQLRDAEAAALDIDANADRPGSATSLSVSDASGHHRARGPVRAGVATLEPLTGRDEDIAAVEALLAGGTRLVTLVGPGGVGKTSLARAVATRRAHSHADGCVIVELAGLADDRSVAPAVAEALGIRTADTDALMALGRPTDRDLLLLLDNCEHLLDGSARVAESLLRSGPHVEVVATSREALGAEGERLHPVRPLAVSGPHSPAVALFERRATALVPDLLIDAEARRLIGRIVERLDGLPLAVEMAAARMPTMSLTELGEAIERDPDLLRSHRRTADDRHRTLRAVIDWSEALLDDAERDVFARMAVFAGRVDGSALEAVIGPHGPDIVRRLAAASLVEVSRTEGNVRFGLLDTVRLHAADRLETIDPSALTMHQHLRWATTVAARADTALRTPAEPQGHVGIVTAFDELRAAHAHARDVDPDTACELSAALLLFGQSRLNGEVLDWIADVRDGGEVPPVAHAAAALHALHRERLDHAAHAAALAAESDTDPRVTCTARETLADVALFSGDRDGCLDHSQRLQELATELGDPHFVVAAAVNEALAATFHGDPTGGAARIRRVDAADLAPSDLGWLAYCRGEILARQGDVADAVSELDRATALADGVGNRYLGGIARVTATTLRARAGNPAEALGSYRALIHRWRREGSSAHLTTTLRNLVPVLVHIGATRPAAEILGAVGPDSPSPTWGDEQRLLADSRERLEALMGPDGLNSSIERGRALSVEGAAEVASRTIDAWQRDRSADRVDR